VIGASAALALVLVSVGGYAAGALLIDPRHDRASLALALVRLASGLLLLTLAFFLSLLLVLPWRTGPAAVVAAALARHRGAALAPPRVTLRPDADAVAAGAIAVAALAPIVVASFRMAPGEFPPVFFNVDTAYFLEKVHALVRTDVYPPESLGVLGGRRAYHFGIHGLAALVARASGLPAHQALFGIVLPLLASALLAAAVWAARTLAPALPRWLSVPMLLLPVPTLWYRFSDAIGSALVEVLPSRSLAPLAALTASWEMWGAASNNAHNVAAHFLVLAALAGIAAAPTIGWRLPVFLVGSAVVVKAPTGVALAAGFVLAQAWRGWAARSPRPLVPAAAAAVLFGVVYGAFWVAPDLPVEFRTELFPFYQIDRLIEREALGGVLADTLWILLPALVVVASGARDPEGRSLPWLVMAMAPLVVVNSLRSIDVRPGGGVDDDWLQVALPVPLLLHAFVISLAGWRWNRLGPGVRAAVTGLLALSVLPPAAVAARYVGRLVLTPELGHEFVDNRALGEALSGVPVPRTVIVTNDQRDPAEGVSRDAPQMQVPALLGHQAFAVNYVYEVYDFSDERRALQALLQAPAWSDQVEAAARQHGWTHLLVRTDYPHPEPVPLERVFENDTYAVYRFAPS
jgi:hypothetical protein